MGTLCVRAAAASIAVLAAVVPAVAEQAFLCEGGRIVYATDQTLEALKREDACVAGYFGLKVEGKPAAATTVPAKPGSPAGGKNPPALELRPSSAALEVARQRQASAPRRFHEIDESLRQATSTAGPQPLRIINAAAAGQASR